MPFSTQKFILFDVQTTGTNPETSDIIEAGWGVYHASADPLTVDWQVRLVELRESGALSRRIQKLTGLAASTWEAEPAVSYEALSAELSAFLREHEGLPILVHYARFKRPFLFKALTDAGLKESDALWTNIQERMACTYDLARRMLPHLKSYSLRAVAGYAGYSLGDKKRSRDHLIATAYIWKYMVEEGSRTETPATTLPLQDPAIRQKRLALPDAPGVYYFLDQAQRILYVGKASSLKHRLNSYFRGQKTKGSRLNEMLTRAVDFQYRVVSTELEALFLESDEIKRIDPPYNRLLKTDERRVQSFRLNDWLLPSEVEPPLWGSPLWGPFLSIWNFQWLLSLSGAAMKPEALPTKRWVDAFFQAELWDEAKILIFGTRQPDWEAWRLWAQSLWEASREEQESEELEEEEEDTEEAVLEEAEEATPEQAAALMQSTLLQALRQRQRARWLLRLMECEILWQFRDAAAPFYRLSLRNGVPSFHASQAEPAAPENWRKSREERLQNVDLPMHDRLTILYSELRKGLRRGDRIQMCLRPGLVFNQDELSAWLL